MALTFTTGHTFTSGETLTPTKLNDIGNSLTAAATDLRVLGTAGSTVVGEITYTAAGLTLLQAANAAAQRTALSLPTFTTAGTNMAEAANVAAQQTLLGINNQQARVSTQFDKTDTTLANATGLTTNLVSGNTYSFRAVLFVTQDTQPAVGKSKVAMAGTATGSAVTFDAAIYSTGVAPAFERITSLASGTSVAASSTSQTVRWEITGTITCNGSGTLTVQFAQLSASGTSSVLVGSYMQVWAY